MALKDRDYDTILKGLREIAQTLENLSGNAKRLNTEAAAAEGELKDRVGKKDIDTIKNLAQTISKTVAPGEEQIRELIRKVEQEKREFEDLER